MKRHFASIMFAAILTLGIASTASAQNGKAAQDTDTRINQAKVVEVSSGRIAVIAQSGVEHVIAVKENSTKILRNGKSSSVTQLSEGDIVTVELDPLNPMKVAKNIRLNGNSTFTELASIPE